MSAFASTTALADDSLLAALPTTQENPKIIRDGVIMVIFNASNMVLAGYKNSRKCWQLPQGGLDGEPPEVAVYREMLEETGIQPHDVRLLGTLPHTTLCTLPARASRNFDIQHHTWMLFRYLPVTPPDLQRATDPPGERFDALAWMGFREMMAKCADFRLPCYEAGLRMIVDRSELLL